MARYMAARREMRRAKLIEILGGICSHCGETGNLEIDHVQPGSASFRFSGKALDRSWDKLLDELQKCQLLCHNCHRIKTVANKETGSNRIDDHGTEAVYAKGCRCEPCRRARYNARVKRGELKGTRGPRGPYKRKTMGH